MGVKNFGKKIILGKVLKELPMLTRLINWLNDPTKVGRKRSIAAIATIFGAALHGIEKLWAASCAAGDISMTVCKFNPGLVANVFDFLAALINEALIPGASAIAILMSAWGLWDARKKTVLAVEVKK